MGYRVNRYLKSFIVIIIAIFIGCASVPKEVVELSYTMGQDLNAVHVSYNRLIKAHFDGLRRQIDDFIEYKWKPYYLENYISDSELTEMVRNGDPSEVLDYLQVWVEVAIEEIEAKRDSLIMPIDKNELELELTVDEAFARIITANATITAHLNSIREVKEVQDEALAGLKLKDLRDKINTGLNTASKMADDAIIKLDTIINSE